MKIPSWLFFTLSATTLWGFWGAFTNLPAEQGFPETLIYVVWALTMIPPALFVLHRVGWKIKRDRRAILLGLVIGLLGAGGQMILFHAVKVGPAYLIFPLISLSPGVTILLSYFLLKERTGKLGIAGIVLAMCALPLFDYAPASAPTTYGLWFALAIGVMTAWGLQAYFIKLANATMDVESIFFYMMVTGLAFVPLAVAMTDFSKPVNMGFSGPGMAAIIQMLNSIGALMLVYAFRHGKALVVSPLINAGAPLLTSLIAIGMAASMSSETKLAGIVLALVAALLLALQPDEGALAETSKG